MTTYRIAPDESKVWIEAKSSLHPIEGDADGLEGTIEALVDGDKVELSEPPNAHIELPVERLRSGNAMYDRELQRRVDARKFPTIKGEAVELERQPDGGYRVRGKLTFHGVTQTVEGEIRLSAPDDRTLVVEGERVFDIRDFGVQPPKILMLRVHPEVKVRIRVVAEREE